MGLNLLVASLFVPVGVGNLALSFMGAGCVVAGTLTLLVHLVGRLLGLSRRADRVVSRGRPEVLLPGVRPPQLYVRSRQAAAAQGVVVNAPRPAPVIDLTDDAAVGLPAVPQRPPGPRKRSGSPIG